MMISGSIDAYIAFRFQSSYPKLMVAVSEEPRLHLWASKPDLWVDFEELVINLSLLVFPEYIRYPLRCGPVSGVWTTDPTNAFELV